MKPVASLSFPVIITFILVAGSSGKHAKRSFATTEAESDIVPYIRHHRSGRQERVESKTPSPMIEPTTHYRTPSMKDFVSQAVNERASRERQGAKAISKKSARKAHHKNKKDAWKKHGSKYRESSLESNEFLYRPQSDASNNTVNDIPKGIPGADPKTFTEKSPSGSLQPSNSTSLAGCVNKLENITMCVKDIPTKTPSTVSSVPSVTAESSEMTISSNNYAEPTAIRDESVKLYNQHRTYIFQHFCKNPIPELITVAKYYPDHGTYSPAITVLHRCRSPCCDVDDICEPLTTENISLIFKIARYSSSSGSRTIRKMSSLETLNFTNHTSCTCYSKNMTSSIASNEMNEVQRGMNEIQRDAPSEEADGEDHANEEEEQEEEEEMEEEKVKMEVYKRGCGCAPPFVENPEDGPCRCDCNREDGQCSNFKLGVSYIDHKWWRCIKSGECTAPQCHYGDFSMQFGRCPKKKEYFDRL